jgi:predicted transcriptional regulator
MKINELVNSLQFNVLTDNKVLDKEVSGVYICDLLSWVMSHANKGDIWITVHTHINIVAVAVLVEIPCIIVPEGIKVEESTINKANEEGIVILNSDKPAYQIAVELGKIL